MKVLKQFLMRLARLLGLSGAPVTLDQLADLAEKIEPRATIEIPLSEAQKLSLKDIATGTRSSGSQRGEAIVLFAGLQGTGKTIAAEVLARDLGRDLYRVDLHRVVSKYIGETEKNLNRLLSAAEEANVILFFDEADALFGKRGEIKEAHDRYANIEVGYLLQQLEAFKGVAILATNNEDNIEVGVRRRIRFVMKFPPD
jgi:SpoVK/Ycf46/Vps4 family AAA+-type ATPase